MTDLHSVKQRWGDGGGGVGCCNEQHLRQIIWDVEVTVVETTALKQLEVKEKGSH